jgi:DNA-binding XRE family transcriptional regulator
MNLELKMKIIGTKRPQIYLAQKLGIPEPYLSKIVNGWINPKPELKKRIADALGVQVSEIFLTGNTKG